MQEETNGDGELVENRPPTMTLTRTQLTAALLLVTVAPFLLVVFMYRNLPYEQDPVLEAALTIGPRSWPNDTDPEARIVPCAILSNPTEDNWRNVNLSINEQFHFKYPDPVDSGEEIFVPLKFFHTKGNQFYPPHSQELKSLIVYAQIPSGARAILEVDGAVLERSVDSYNEPVTQQALKPLDDEE